jgi:DNA-binding response OmpR family regulator
VEDETETCELLTNLFKPVGYDVITAPSFIAAWGKVINEKFDLYLLDHWLPGGSGLELCQRIRAVDLHTPVVFFTGAAYETERQAALAAGAQAYLVKPRDIAQLVATVERLLLNGQGGGQRKGARKLSQ